MRRAWLAAIVISLTTHAALLAVSVHLLFVPARVDVAPGEQGTSRIRVGLITDPESRAPQEQPRAEPQIEAAQDIRTDLIALKPPPDTVDQPSRPQATAQKTASLVEQAAVTPWDEREYTGSGAAPGIETQPLSSLNRPPSYPAIARQMGWEGTVVLEVEVSADGRVGDVSVAESSGHAVLDRAAAGAVRAWRFEPAQRLGEPIASHVRLPVQFQLISP